MSRKALAGLVLALAFGLGVATGWALHRPPGTTPPSGPPPGVGAEAYAPLGLSDEQRARIDEIFAQAMPRSDSIMLSALERVRAQLRTVDAAVREILNAEQIRRLDSLQAADDVVLPGVRLRQPRRD